MNDKLRILADGYLEDSLDAVQIQQLESILQSDPVAKRNFVEYTILHGHLGVIAEEFCSVPTPNSVGLIVTKRSASSAWMRSFGLAIAASALVFVLRWPPQPSDRDIADVGYDLQQYPIRTVGYAFPESRSGAVVPIAAGSSGSANFTSQLSSARGVNVSVAYGSRFSFASDQLGLLFAGSAFVSANDANSIYAVEMGDRRLLSYGAQFELTKVDADRAKLDVRMGHVEIQTRLSGPRLRWSFDDASEDDLPISLNGKSSRIDGVVGKGAIEFADIRGTFAEIIGGTEPTVGSGLFAFNGGMTIETIISSRWDAMPGNQDVIFRKEDGPNRILLSFQNDENDYEIPVVESGPVLSFGIYLEGLGYSELDMPLDGKNGRPTVDKIADGKPHLIAATYDSFTGMKAITVDGRICFSHRFPVGHCIQSGGPRPAKIGGWRRTESFSGVIDELAIYDYALSLEEITHHYQLTQQGSSWLPKRSNIGRGWETIETVREGAHVLLGSEGKGRGIN